MYLVLKRFRALGVTYEPGTTAEFQKETAKHLLAIGRVEKCEAPVVDAEEKVEAPTNRAEKPKKTRRKKA